jgi:hypothetical protein
VETEHAETPAVLTNADSSPAAAAPAVAQVKNQPGGFDFCFWPFWHAAVKPGSRRQVLQQEQQQDQPPQQAPAQPLAGMQQNSVSTGLIPDLSNASSAADPQCPADTAFNAAAGTCISRAGPTTSTPEVPVISELTLEVPQEQASLQGLGLNRPPIDPGSEATVALGPDGVAVEGSDTTSGPTDSNGVTRAVAPYNGPSSQVTRTLTTIANSKIKVGQGLCVAGKSRRDVGNLRECCIRKILFGVGPALVMAPLPAWGGTLRY